MACCGHAAPVAALGHRSWADPRPGGELALRLRSQVWGSRVDVAAGRCLSLPAPSGRCLVRAARQKLWKNRQAEVPQVAVKKVLDAVQKEGANVQEVLMRKGAFIKPQDWFLVLDAVGEQRRWLLALEIFRWMQLQKWYKPDNAYYSKMISIMGKEKQLRLAMWLFAEMKRKGLRPSTSMYNALIAAQVAMTDIPGTLDKALSMLQTMKERKQSQPSIVTYNTLTKAFAQTGDVERVNSLLAEAEAMQLAPNMYTYNGIISAYGKLGQLERMEQTYELMRARKLKPDKVTLNCLIHAYGKAGHFDKAEKLLRRMMQSKQTPADVKTFNSLIHAYGQAGKLEEMEVVAEKLIDAGLAPTSSTFECMLAAYSKAGAFQSVQECLDAMRAADLRPSYTACRFVLEAMCERGEADSAEKLLRDPLLAPWLAEDTLYNVVLKAYAVAGRSADIERLLKKMEKSGIRVDRPVLLDLLQTYAKERNSSPSAGSAEKKQDEARSDSGSKNGPVEDPWSSGGEESEPDPDESPGLSDLGSAPSLHGLLAGPSLGGGGKEESLTRLPLIRVRDLWLWQLERKSYHHRAGEEIDTPMAAWSDHAGRLTPP